MAKKSSFTFGSDPEFMLNKKGKYISAIEVLKRDKDNKIEVDGNHFYYDNVMAEAAIKPSSSKAETIKNFGEMLTAIAKLVKPCKIECRASADFPADQLQSEEAKRIGCSPEFCAYELNTIIPPTEQFASGTLRTSGGHVHVGAKIAKDEYGCLHIIRLLDLFLGIPATMIDKDPTSKRRKELYGNAGRFRTPPHGCEYRSIGNFWLTTPALVGLVYDITEWTVGFVVAGKHEELWEIDFKTLEDEKSYADVEFTVASCHKCIGYDLDLLRKTINTMDVEKAKTFMPVIARYMPAGLVSDIEMAIKSARQYDIYKEWSLK